MSCQTFELSPSRLSLHFQCRKRGLSRRSRGQNVALLDTQWDDIQLRIPKRTLYTLMLNKYFIQLIMIYMLNVNKV